VLVIITGIFWLFSIMKHFERINNLKLSDVNVERPKSTWTENDFIISSDRFNFNHKI